MNFTYCLQATEERRRNTRGNSRQLLAAHEGRTKQEQCSQAAQVIGKCLICLLVVAPPLPGQKSAPPPANAHRASLAFKGIRRPILSFPMAPQLSTVGQIRPRALHRKAPSIPIALQIMGNR